MMSDKMNYYGIIFCDVLYSYFIIWYPCYIMVLESDRIVERKTRIDTRCTYLDALDSDTLHTTLTHRTRFALIEMFSGHPVKMSDSE
ncbi:hypothetical protein Y032_0001g363 [Ancylostoma ceylanicum]|uniref:Uncharacterized protein n=1 Tax=Ancylostoma ceylanicum TaxID=53326 RepID=A0A016W4V4_9BILA|nr:hypothetical protein Y032_0001g363 [Ancylostoma ceylanicum]